MNYITFDIETYSPSKSDKFDINEFRCSVCGAYISWIDEYVAFLESDILDFLELTRSADLIIGYNHLGFDLPVLQKYVSWNLLNLPSYDIMMEVYNRSGVRLRLNDLCKANLADDVKTDNYEQFKNYYWDKEWAKLIDYCMNDVRLTEKLFKKIKKRKRLKYFDLHEIKEVFLEKPKPAKMPTIKENESLL